MARLGSFALVLLLSASVASADVVPARYANPEAGAARTRVAERLEGLGMRAEDARSRAAGLADDDALFFAAAPERVRAAGQDGTERIPNGEKMILGAAFLSAAIAGIAIAAAN
jgi:hypothetical protein